jgi:hypothetical protein
VFKIALLTYKALTSFALAYIRNMNKGGRVLKVVVHERFKCLTILCFFFSV